MHEAPAGRQMPAADWLEDDARWREFAEDWQNRTVDSGQAGYGADEVDAPRISITLMVPEGAIDFSRRLLRRSPLPTLFMMTDSLRLRF